MKQKTHKALSKRVVITKNQKVLKRKAGQDHFNSRDSGEQTMGKRRDRQLSQSYNEAVRTLMPHDWK